jgi:C1A family cysteine protease
MGWVPDLPDFRDFFPGHENITQGHEQVSKFFEKKGLLSDSSNSSKVIISDDAFSPIEDQGQLGSCTANAAVGLMEYYQKKTQGKFIDMSRLFLYKATRNLLGWTGDTGAYLRTTMGAMVIFGSPPESYWPYKIQEFDKEPPAFMYSFAKEFQSVRYFRLDPQGVTEEELLKRIKMFLERKMPSMFGFTVYNSISQASSNGEIPFPCDQDRREGGHAIVATGFDDNKEIVNKTCGKKTKGAIRIRNSWGQSWGDNGYGWIPYDYILNGLAMDWWSLLRNEWINLPVFEL